MPSPFKSLAKIAQAVDKTIVHSERPKVIYPHYSVYDSPCESSNDLNDRYVEPMQASVMDSSALYSAVIGQAGSVSMLWVATGALSMAATTITDNITQNVTSLVCERADFYNHTLDAVQPIMGQSDDLIVKQSGMLIPLMEMAIVFGYCMYLNSIMKSPAMALEPEKSSGSYMGKLFSSYHKPSISIEVVSDEELGLASKKLK